MATQTFEILLIGDSGNIKRNGSDPLIDLLKENLPASTNSAVIFLGDNIYPKGMPPEGHLLRADAEKVLEIYHDTLKEYQGRTIFISGNHDWNKGKDNGLEYVLRQEQYIRKLFQSDESFIPENGCPGPKVIELTEQLTLIAINTQWWIQKGKKPLGRKCGCNVDHEKDFYRELTQAIEENKHKRIVVIGHYPIYSDSLHGGKYKMEHHLFPLTIYKKNAYLPLPFVGSLLPLYRKYIGAKEDLSHPRFRVLRKKLKAIFKNYPGLIYAAGHEHNLQWIEKNENTFIVSGSASKATYVLEGKYAKYGISAKGFFRLKFFDDLTVKAEVIITDTQQKKGELVYDGWVR